MLLANIIKAWLLREYVVVVVAAAAGGNMLKARAHTSACRHGYTGRAIAIARLLSGWSNLLLNVQKAVFGYLNVPCSQ